MKWPERPALSQMSEGERKAFEQGHAIGLEAGLRMGWVNALTETQRAVGSAFFDNRVPAADLERAIAEEARREAGLS